MKKLLIVLLFPTVLFAQKKSEVYKKLATLTCECASKKTDKSDMSLGLCIFESLDKINAKEQKVIGYNPDKKIETVEKVAEQVGVEMALTCPDIMTAYSATDEVSEEEVVEDTTYITFTGVLEEIKSSEFNTIVLVNDAKEKKEFIWLFPFDNDAMFVKGKISKGDKIELEYREQSFFDPKKKEYRNYNEITGVKFLN